jgi:hypothetical protein
LCADSSGNDQCPSTDDRSKSKIETAMTNQTANRKTAETPREAFFLLFAVCLLIRHCFLPFAV